MTKTIFMIAIAAGLCLGACGQESEERQEIKEEMNGSPSYYPDSTPRDHTAVKDSINNNNVLLPAGGE